MKRFYAHLRDKASVAQALAMSQNELLVKFGADTPPVDWAGFTLMGEGTTEYPRRTRQKRADDDVAKGTGEILQTVRKIVAKKLFHPWWPEQQIEEKAASLGDASSDLLKVSDDEFEKKLNVWLAEFGLSQRGSSTFQVVRYRRRWLSERSFDYLR